MSTDCRTTRTENEYPFYSDAYLAQKAREHEVRYADLPEDSDDPGFERFVMNELQLLSVQEMIDCCLATELTAEQMSVLRHFLAGRSIQEICEIKMAQNGRKVSDAAVRRSLMLGGRKIISLSSESPFFGWFLVYLEDVLRKKLF